MSDSPQPGDHVLAWNDISDSTESGTLVKIGCYIDEKYPVVIEKEGGQRECYQSCMLHPDNT